LWEGWVCEHQREEELHRHSTCDHEGFTRTCHACLEAKFLRCIAAAPHARDATALSIRSKPDYTPGQLRLVFNEDTNAHGACSMKKQMKLHALAHKNAKVPKQVITLAGIRDESH